MAPASATAAASRCEFESWIWPRRSGAPAGTNSLPVEMMAMRGARCTTTSPHPTAAAAASCRAVSSVPTGSTSSPACTSLPARLMNAAGAGVSLIATRAVPWSVASIGTIASAPSGSGAPVMIRATVPGTTTVLCAEPAAISAITGSTTGASALAPRRSSRRTA